MADELIDTFDEDNNPTGIKKMKHEAHRHGLWHRCSHVWIYNSKGEMLIQLRAKNKTFYPNLWDIPVAGHVKAGESPVDAALREMKEEIGLRIKQEDLVYFMIKKVGVVYKGMYDNEFFYVYLYKFDGNINDLMLQEEEVEDINMISVEKLEDDLKTNPDKYVAHGKYWTDVLEEIKKR